MLLIDRVYRFLQPMWGRNCAASHSWARLGSGWRRRCTFSVSHAIERYARGYSGGSGNKDAIQEAQRIEDKQQDTESQQHPI
jgi:hypothetical protein